MVLILEDAYLGEVKKVRNIFITNDNGSPTLKMEYVDERGKEYTFTSKDPNRDRLLREFKSIVQQIKAQDKAFVDQAFEDTVLK